MAKLLKRPTFWGLVVLALAEGPAVPVAASAAEDRAPGPQLPVRVARAVERGVDYLKRSQNNGVWEKPPLADVIKGGVTALTVLALLDSGVQPDDPVLAKALAYLRDVPPTKTYVVSLQTLVLARARQAGDGPLIRRNVDWLLKARCRTRRGDFDGWSYASGRSLGGDNSNTEFAVLALDAAQQADVKIDKAAWRELRRYYLTTQRPDGGWVYNPALNGVSTLSMTSAGICGVLLCGKQLNEETDNKTKTAMAHGLEYLGKNFRLDPPVNEYYELYGIARIGGLAKRQQFVGKDGKSLAWYSAGAEWLLQRQAKDGSWPAKKGKDTWAVINTSFAILFLVKPTR